MTTKRSDELSTQFMVTDNDVSVIQFGQVLAALPEPDLQEVERNLS